MIAMSFAVTALALSVSAFLRAGMVRLARFETLAALAALGLVVGSLRLINSWDYPVQLLFAAGFIFAGEFLYGHSGKLKGIAHAFVKVVIVAAFGYVVFLPFHQNFELFNNGLELSKFTTALWRYGSDSRRVPVRDHILAGRRVAARHVPMAKSERDDFGTRCGRLVNGLPALDAGGDPSRVRSHGRGFRLRVSAVRHRDRRPVRLRARRVHGVGRLSETSSGDSVTSSSPPRSC